MFSVTILGNNSAVPAYERLPTSQLVNMDGQKFLVDCGEGTQLQLMRYKVKYSRISHIFISHLHGDHYFGLIGLINSFGLLNRQQDLYVFGPPPLKNIIELQLQVASTRLPFSLHLKEIAKPGVLMESDDIEVSALLPIIVLPATAIAFAKKE
jgi:ribonuclease Z